MNEEVILYKVRKGKGPTGAPNVKTDISEKVVFADVQSIMADEYYQAERIGRKLSFVATLYRADYDGETEIGYDGGRYDVIRQYIPKKTRDKIELHCAERKEV